jgi:fibronectin type 3 domain-containing protein
MRSKQTTTTRQQRRNLFYCLPLLMLLLEGAALAVSGDRRENLRPGESAYQMRVIREAPIERKFDYLALRVRATGTISVIVQLAAPGQNSSHIEQVQNDLLESLVGYDPGTVKRFSYLPILGIRINLTGLESLRASTLVQDIEEDVRMSPITRVRPRTTESTVVRPAEEWNGAGQTIVQLEVRGGHERLVETPTSKPRLDCSHDRSLCDAALPVRAGEGRSGDLAPATTVLSIFVSSHLEESRENGDCPDEGVGGGRCETIRMTDIYQAIDQVWELREARPVAAVQWRLGVSPPTTDCDQDFSILKRTIDQLRTAGIGTIVDGEEFRAPACLSNTLDPGRVGPVRLSSDELAAMFAIARQKAPRASVEEILMALTSPVAIGHSAHFGNGTGGLNFVRALEQIGIGPGNQPEGSEGRNEIAPQTIPTDLLATALSTTQVELVWTDNSFNELGFLIRRRAGTDGPWLVLATVGTNATSYRDLSVMPGQTYFYAITPVTITGESPSSTEVSITMPIFSFVPVGVGQTVSGSVVIGRSQFYRISVPQGVLQLLVQTSGTGNIDLFTRHAFQPTRNNADCRSVNDTTAERCVFYAPTPGDWHILVFGNARASNNFLLHVSYIMGIRTDVPNTPTNLQAAATSSSQVELRWTDTSTNELGFIVWRKTGINGTWTEIATVGAGITNYLDTGRDPDLLYIYQVISFNSTGVSPPSNEARATTPGALTARPSAPTGLSARVPTPSVVSLQWVDNSNNEQGFRIRRRTGNSDLWAVIATVEANTTSFQDLRVFPETTYFYSVTAFNTAGESGGSNEARVTTVGGSAGGNLSAIPLNLQVTAISTTHTVLKWMDNSFNELGFRVRRKVGLNGNWNLIAILGANVTDFRDEGLIPGNEYVYQISSFNSTGDSPGSNEVSIQLPINAFFLLNNGIPINHTVGQDRALFYRIHVPIGTTELLIQTKGGGSNALFVRYGLQPSNLYFNCRSLSNTSNNRCLFPNPTPGDWHIMVSTSTLLGSNYNVTATYVMDPILSRTPTEESSTGASASPK